MTVRQFQNTLNTMRQIYNFDDERTTISTFNPTTMNHDIVSIKTIDKETGVLVHLSHSDVKPFEIYD